VIKVYALLSTFPHLEWVAPTLRIADVGAQLRADYYLRTPDALQALPPWLMARRVSFPTILVFDE
jgi:hypothetical protein